MAQQGGLDYDVVVVGGGNAAMCAARSARDQGARVILVEKAPMESRGGNCPYTGGGFRFTHRGAADIRPLLADPSEIEGKEIPPYTAAAYKDDMLERTKGMTNPELLDTLIAESYPTVLWMKDRGIQFQASFGTRRDEKGQRQGRVGVSAVGSGAGLIRMHYTAARRHGVEVVYQTKMLNLLQDSRGHVVGVRVRDRDGTHEIHSRGVVLACGGFEASQEMRLKYLGGPWERAKVRGSKHNTGDGLRAALEAGAKITGQWTGCHATPIDVNAPEVGATDVVDRMPRRSYPYGVMLNVLGQRFIDEGEDYALNNFVDVGRKILEQPRGLAFQLFDSKVASLLEPRYGSATVVTANTIEELAQKLGLNPKALVRTVQEFNAAVQGGAFDPDRRDGKGTLGITPPKSNWALPLDSPPFVAYPVTGGITYTFGGLKVNRHAQVLDTEDNVIPGLYAAGEIVGGFFYYDSLRASGLMHGAVFGRLGGANAAREPD